MKALEITGTVLTVVLFIVAAISMHTLIGSFTGSLMGRGEEGPFVIQTTWSTAGDVSIRFSMFVRNEGMLGAGVRLNVKILGPDGGVIAAGEGSKLVAPGSTEMLTVDLYIGREEARKYLSGNIQPRFSIFFECRTLYDLLGMGVQTEV